MAPFVGPGKQAVLKRLRALLARGFPLTLGEYQPQAVIQEESGRWVLRALEMDRARADAAGKAAIAKGEMWMPEMEFQFLAPGKVLAEGKTRSALADAIERLAWPFGGDEPPEGFPDDDYDD
ncbi:MAG: hypothetical protein JST54_08495 [Deltaproteobacteria bacterium]|nr:hypothetical protein [Deltaproteobacteria bacterium]